MHIPDLSFYSSSDGSLSTFSDSAVVRNTTRNSTFDMFHESSMSSIDEEVASEEPSKRCVCFWFSSKRTRSDSESERFVEMRDSILDSPKSPIINDLVINELPLTSFRPSILKSPNDTTTLSSNPSSQVSNCYKKDLIDKKVFFQLIYCNES